MTMLSTSDRVAIEAAVIAASPKMGTTYLLWLFLGGVSAHRFYLGRPGSAFLQIALNLIAIGLIWTLLDVFFIPGMVRAARDEIRMRLVSQAASV